MVEKNSRELHVYPYKPVSWLATPDEWTTTKQACRDKRVVLLSFLYHIYIYIYIYISVGIFKNPNPKDSTASSRARRI